MKIQVQFNCPVGVIVDTETGEVDSVHVWDEHIDTTQPTGASRDEYVKVGHPDFERAVAGDEPDFQDFSRRYGKSLYEPLPLEHPEVVKAIAVAQSENVEWPAWGFGS